MGTLTTCCSSMSFSICFKRRLFLSILCYHLSSGSMIDDIMARVVLFCFYQQHKIELPGKKEHQFSNLLHWLDLWVFLWGIVLIDD